MTDDLTKYLDALRKLNAATTDAAKAVLEERAAMRRLDLALHNALKVDPPVIFYLLPPGKDKHSG